MSIFQPSANIASLRESATIAASARAKALRAAGRPILDLGAGEPDFPTPPFVLETAHRALDAGFTRYTQVEGILPLREVIAERASALHRSAIEPDCIVVGAGTKQVLFNAIFSLFSLGDEVLIPTPGWTSYYEMVGLARATPVVVRGARANGLKVTPDDLRASATAATRGLILNSPSNPTGAVYTRNELIAITELAVERDWWILSDEIYRAISYDGPATSMLEVGSSLERLVVADGVAKSFAMTGWRIGWSIAPRPLARAMTALQSHTTSNAATLSQHAALAALSNRAAGDSAIAGMVAEFKRRRDLALTLLHGAGMDVIDPSGAFYLYIRAANGTLSDPEPGTTLARRLLDEHDVAVVPGAAFHSPEWIRASYAAPAEDVLEGVRRIISARIS
jgi:aspartate aminotransferase